MNLKSLSWLFFPVILTFKYIYFLQSIGGGGNLWQTKKQFMLQPWSTIRNQYLCIDFRLLSLQFAISESWIINATQPWRNQAGPPNSQFGFRKHHWGGSKQKLKHPAVYFEWEKLKYQETERLQFIYWQQTKCFSHHQPLSPTNSFWHLQSFLNEVASSSQNNNSDSFSPQSPNHSFSPQWHPRQKRS